MNPLTLLTVCLTILPSALAKPAPLLSRGHISPRSGLHDCGVFIQRVSSLAPCHCPFTHPTPPRHFHRALLTSTVVGLLLRHLRLQQFRHIRRLLRLGLHPHR